MAQSTPVDLHTVEALIAKAKFDEANIELVRRNFGDDPELIEIVQERAQRSLTAANESYQQLCQTTARQFLMSHLQH